MNKDPAHKFMSCPSVTKDSKGKYSLLSLASVARTQLYQGSTTFTQMYDGS